MKKKGSVFVTAFLIAVAIGIFIMISSKPTTTTTSRDIDNPEKYAEETSATIYDALKNSGALGTKNTGQYGVLEIDNGYFISYSVTDVPSVEEVKGKLSDKIKEVMNVYLKDINGKTLYGMKVKSDAQIEKITVGVTEEEVLAGAYDNTFSVTAKSTGSVVFTPQTGEAKTFQQPDYNVPIDNWRFWLMYRKVRAWSIDNMVGKDACNKMPQYGIRGNSIDCKYAPIKLETAKAIFDKDVKILQESFDEDDLCIQNCPVKDPDCTTDATTPGTCAADNYCASGCEPVDPDCQKCNYIQCTYEFLCGEESVDSNHAGVEYPCGPKQSQYYFDSNGQPDDCPGDCVAGCEYINSMESCFSGACDDPFCPKQGASNYNSLKPTCNSGEIKFTAPNYIPPDGPPEWYDGDPNVKLGTCYGVGTQYKWSLIAEVTCRDKKYEKPLSTAGFETLPLKFRVHQYFKERKHEPYVNECEHSLDCVVGPGGGGAGAGEPDTGNNDNSDDDPSNDIPQGWDGN
ncbi:MAG: hypothetical protein V1859_09285 [archaeon]